VCSSFAANTLAFSADRSLLMTVGRCVVSKRQHV
jgi:hypothetical protein